jgi:hypothetical protein
MIYCIRLIFEYISVQTGILQYMGFQEKVKELALSEPKKVEL